MSEWWDEDPELLGATLGLLAAWDSGGVTGGDRADSPAAPSTPPSPALSPSSPDSCGHTATTASECGARRRRSINVSRERRKQELQFLRKKADDMQRQLSELRARREAQLQPHFRDAQHTQLATVAPVWESLATRQFRARKRSELRNAKLKTMLSAQLRVAEDLIRVIRHAEQRTRSATPAVTPSLPRLPIDVSQRLSEEDQLQRLDMLCANWSQEIARCDKFAPRGTLQFLDMKVVEDSGGETVIELFSSSVLPFAVARVEETMWNLFVEEGGTDEETGDSFSQTTSSTNDLVIAVFSATSTLDSGLRGTMHGKFVTKRFHPTATQTIMATHTQSEPQGYGNQLDGVEAFEDSWVRLVDASELGHEQLGGPLTVVQHVRRERIIVRDSGAGGGDVDAAAARSRVETVTQIVMNQIREEIDWAQQTVENLLTASSATGGRLKGEQH